MRAELAERPDDSFVLFNLGSIAIERQDWRPAIPLLRKSLAGSATSDSNTRKLFALIARCHQMLGDTRRPCGPVPRAWRLTPTMPSSCSAAPLSIATAARQTRSGPLIGAVLAECPGGREAVAKLRQLELAESVC